MRKERGSTLLELLFATSILAIIFLGLGSSIVTSVKSDQSSYDLSIAQNFGRKTMEELLENDWADLLAFDGTYVESGEFRADINVSLAGTDLLSIVIIVSKNDCDLLTIMTYRSNR